MIALPFGNATLFATGNWLTIRKDGQPMLRLTGKEEMSRLGRLLDEIDLRRDGETTGDPEVSLEYSTSHGVDICHRHERAGTAPWDIVRDLQRWLAAATGSCREPADFDNYTVLGCRWQDGQLLVSDGDLRVALHADAGLALRTSLLTAAGGRHRVGSTAWCNLDRDGHQLHGNVGLHRHDDEPHLVTFILRSSGKNAHHELGRSSLALFAEQVAAALAAASTTED